MQIGQPAQPGMQNTGYMPPVPPAPPYDMPAAAPVKPVRIRRIGHLSVGVILVLLGVSMIVALFQNPEAMRIIFKLWPICLVIYGGEILYYTLAYRDREDVLVKYDFLSVLILIVVIGAAFFAFGCAIYADYAIQQLPAMIG